MYRFFFRRKPERPGFTLIELLLVVGVIGVLSSIVILAVNPSRQLGGARDADRRHSAKELQSAQFQYLIDQGQFAADKTIPTDEVNALQICRSGQSHAGCINVDGLSPMYIHCIPYDGAETVPQFSGYQIYQIGGILRTKAAHIGSGAMAGGCEVGPSPVAYWKFDEATIGSNAADSSGNAFHATAVNFATPHGPSGQVPSVHFSDPRSLRFDDSNDHLTVPTTSLLNLNQVFTFAAWVYLEGPFDGDDHEIVMRSNGGGGNELNFAVEDSQAFATHIDGTKYFMTGVVPLNQWVHLASVRNGATLKIYVNGNLNATASPGSKQTNFGTCNTIVIGGDVDSGCTGSLANHWKGYLDDVRLYGVALTDAQVKSLAAGNP